MGKTAAQRAKRAAELGRAEANITDVGKCALAKSSKGPCRALFYLEKLR